jgi:hypothetical protein
MDPHGRTQRKGICRNESVARMLCSSTTRSGMGIAMFRPIWSTSCGCDRNVGGTFTSGWRGSRWMKSEPVSSTASATSHFLWGFGAAGAMRAGVYHDRGARDK